MVLVSKSLALLNAEKADELVIESFKEIGVFVEVQNIQIVIWNPSQKIQWK